MEHATSEHRLLERFSKGDSEAFAVLYSLHHRAIFRFALNMSADVDVAAEITQEVFVWLVENPGRFDPKRAGLATFLIGIARQFLRRRRRLAFRWLPLKEAAEKPAGANVEEEWECSIDVAPLRSAISRLPGRYREAIVLCDLEDRSYEEAAAVVGCTIGTVRSRLHRARELLARKLCPEKDRRKGHS